MDFRDKAMSLEKEKQIARQATVPRQRRKGNSIGELGPDEVKDKES